MDEFGRYSADEMLEEIMKSVEMFKKHSTDYSIFFYTSGTGIPDNIAIDYFKDSNIIVMDRKGHLYQYGKKIER